MSRFVYSLIRAVEPVTGEFVNIGAIAGSDEASDWACRCVQSTSRARKIIAPSIVEVVQAKAASMQLLIEQHVERVESGESGDISEAWLDSLHRLLDRSMQLTEPTPVVADSAHGALDLVFRHLVIDPQHAPHNRSRMVARSQLASAYQRMGVGYGKAVHRQPHVLGTYDSDFDFAVTNGKTVQLAHSFSFENQDSKALLKTILSWSWSALDLRMRGGDLIVDENNAFSIPRDIEIDVLYLPPKTDEGQDALEQALASFTQAGINAVPEGGAAEIVARAQNA